MKIEYQDQFNMTIYLGFFNEDDIEESFKNLFLKLKKYYKITPKGYYIINLYKDPYYGAIIDLEKEDLEYSDYFGNQVDMKINTINHDFIYKLEDYFMIPKSILKKSILMTNKKDLYLKINKPLNYKELAYLMENTKIIYKDIEHLQLIVI